MCHCETAADLPLCGHFISICGISIERASLSFVKAIAGIGAAIALVFTELAQIVFGG